MGVYQRGKEKNVAGSRRVVPLSDRRPFREGENKPDESWVQFCENCKPGM